MKKQSPCWMNKLEQELCVLFCTLLFASILAMASSIRLAVGSKNPVKINSAKVGCQKAFEGKEVDVFGFDVASGVSDQPMTDQETLQGAIARAKNAYEAFVTEQGSPPDFALGLEGGVAPSLVSSSDLECYAWIVVYNGSKFGRARTGSFLLPPPITQLIVGEGLELGAADDKFFGTSNSKQKGGSVGQLTKGVIDRTQYYEHAVVLAFVPFLWGDLYADLSTPIC